MIKWFFFRFHSFHSCQLNYANIFNNGHKLEKSIVFFPFILVVSFASSLVHAINAFIISLCAFVELIDLVDACYPFPGFDKDYLLHTIRWRLVAIYNLHIWPSFHTLQQWVPYTSARASMYALIKNTWKLQMHWIKSTLHPNLLFVIDFVDTFVPVTNFAFVNCIPQTHA